MFGDETTPDSVRPLSPPVNKSSPKKLIFFESEDLPKTDDVDLVVVHEPSLFPEVTFDPTATGAYPIDLDEPRFRVVSGDAESDSHDPSATTEGSIIDLTRPDPSFTVPFTQAPRPPGNGVVIPSSEGWLQQSLFPSSPPPGQTLNEPRTSFPESRSFLDRLNYGNIEDLEDVRWFHRPIIWLVFGLLTVLILFIALLVQDDTALATYGTVLACGC